MTIDRTLSRVDADRAAGRAPLARQRLRGLVASFPDRLDLRARLADSYRAAGEPAQAGRWAYLGGTAAATEVAAFERLYPHPDRRLEVLRWPDDAEDPPDPVGRARLRALRAHSAALADGSAVWLGPAHRPRPTSSWRERLAEAGCLAGLLLGVVVVLLLTGVGGVVVVRWLAR